MMLETTAQEARDICTKRGRVVVAVTNVTKFEEIKKGLTSLSSVYNITIIRIEPNEDSAITFQILKFPSFLYYVDGSEKFVAIGNQEFLDKFHAEIRIG